MASGAQHYEMAERYADMAHRHLTEDPADMRIAEVAAWTAQAYATLALAGATAEAATGVGVDLVGYGREGRRD